MRKRWGFAALILLGASSAVVVLLLALNPAPTVPDASQATDARAPYVVKLHARWCPICMVTRGAWADLQEGYAGRVRFAVFDFTSEATTQASRVQAASLGLEGVFDEYAGETGTVLVLDGASRQVRQALHGHHEDAAYRTAIDAALAGTVR